MWLFFLALHLVGLVGYSLLLRKSLLENVDRWVLATVMQTGVAAPVIIALPFAWPDFGGYDLSNVVVATGATILVISLHWASVKSMQYLEVGVYSILYNLRILFATILGVLFLGEPIVPLQILGGLLILLAVVAVRQKGGKKLHLSGVKWGVAAALIISFLNLSEKNLLGNVGFMGYAVPVMVLSTAIMWGVLFARRQKVDAKLFASPRMLQLMAFRGLSAIGFLLVFYTGGLLSVSTYISSLSVIIIVVLGVLLLGEKDYLKQKIIATILAVLGLTTILLANLF